MLFSTARTLDSQLLNSMLVHLTAAATGAEEGGGTVLVEVHVTVELDGEAVRSEASVVGGGDVGSQDDG